MPADLPPSSADTMNNSFALACEAHSDGRFDEALEVYLQLIVLAPASSLLHYNLGLAYYELQRFTEALQAFILADSFTPDDVDTLFNLALCHGKIGDSAEAILTYEQVLRLAPDHVDSLYNLGGCYQKLHQDNLACEYYQLALAIAPNYLSALNNLAYLYHRSGRREQAIELYTRLLELRPEDESVRFLLAALQGVHLEQAPDAYVRGFFDAYAEDFERSLVEDLGYENPRRLYECLCHTETIGAATYGHGLDLGCGTGLSGQAFKERITVLDGVDLSPAMLYQAEAKGCYHCLCQDNIEHFLASASEQYDFFLATDVFIYVGSLEGVFTHAHAHGCSGALFCFLHRTACRGRVSLAAHGSFCLFLSLYSSTCRQHRVEGFTSGTHPAAARTR